MFAKDAVAIVGYSYRMPGGIRTDADLWRLLSERDIIQESITNRYGKGYQPIGGFSGPGRFASPYEGLILDGEELLFDCKLFGMSLHEAENMDPQMKLLLTCTWETFEQVGWDLDSLCNSPTGVFIGAQAPVAGSWRPLHGVNEYSNAGISLAMQANRISYYFNLTGPSMSCCTACSAGLSALHLAMNALRGGDCQQAVIGSANYLGGSLPSLGFNALGIISPDGKCYSFDAKANGYMRSEGAFVFAIKPLEAAERDGDPIHAVVEATALNTAGLSDTTGGLAPRPSIFAPTRRAQVELMQIACDRANCSPQEFDYIEAHATGTQVGDPIEANAIAEAFGGFRNKEAPLRVSSIKSNVGHMEAAAFHCSLLKVLLMMQRRTFAPISNNFSDLNPEIDFDQPNIQVQTTCEPFPDRPVVVGINSFGFGGANGHCVVREYLPAQPRIWSVALSPETSYMIPLSARTSEALIQSAQQLQEALGKQTADLYTLAGNLSRRRTHFPVRTAFAVRSCEELTKRLNTFVQEGEPVTTVDEGKRYLTMVFSGQGTQWAGCGRTLYDADPVFRRVIDAIEEHWREHSDISLREACFSAEQSVLDEVELAQPIIFMIQCALVELFKTWGVYPDCVVGHSSGEVAAAYACGALSLAEATRLIFHRATLQQRIAGSGRMLAISLDRPGVEELLETLRVAFRSEEDLPTQVEIACENAPASTVICGKETVLQPIMEELNRRNLQHQLIPGNIAFHSSAMDSLKDAALSALSFLNDCTFDAEVPLISSVTGEKTDLFDNAYWWSNIRQPVQFTAAMKTIKQHYRPDVVLEIAPHSALQPIIAQCLTDILPAPTCIPTLMRNTDAGISFNQALGSLYHVGVKLDFAAQYPCPEPITHLLLGHPREEKPTLNPMIDDKIFVKRGEYSHGPLVGHKIPCDHLLFEARLSEKDFPWLLDHRVYHTAIMPAAGYIELILEALGGGPVHFDVIEFLQPCPIPRIPVRLQTALHPVADTPDEFTFSISSQSYDIETESQLHCRGKVRRVNDEYEVDVPQQWAEVDKTRFKPTRIAQSGDFYTHLEATLGDDFQYGPFFQTVQRVDTDIETKTACSELVMNKDLWATGREEGYILPPSLTDGGLQMFLYYMIADLSSIPRRARHITFFRPPTSPRITCQVTYSTDRSDWNETSRFASLLGERSAGSVSFYDSATGFLVAHIEDYICFNTNSTRADLQHSKHIVSWQPKSQPSAQLLMERLPEGEIEPVSLITTLKGSDHGNRYACHVVEFAGDLAPDQTVLKQYLESHESADGQTEFWLISNDEESATAHYKAFGHHATSLRFECLDLDVQPIPMPDKGLLRPGAAELLFLHCKTGLLGPDVWQFLHQLAAPGGLALICHNEDDIVEPGTGWTRVHTGKRTTLLQATQVQPNLFDPTDMPAPRWVLGEPGSWAAEWAAMISAPGVHSIPYENLTADTIHGFEDWPQSIDLQAIDFFCGMSSHDPTGEEVLARFVSFVQALVSYRIENANDPCRLTVVTHKAAFEVEDPRGSALWGAVRSMSTAVGEEAKIDFRLVDLGSSDDLHTLAELWNCDLRERELAVRHQRLWVPRVISIQEEFPLVPAGEDPAYRLYLDNPGQISGLKMRTYELAELGPRDVEVEVVAVALNFRDLMVTLDLLPIESYKWSSFGREVGMEASGIVRRIGSDVRYRAVGDEVMFMQGGCIANRIVANEHLVFPKPVHLNMVEAAAVSSVYPTAYYALVYLARLEKDQRVLIHSAMGGVGQAAIAIAKYVGAEIYATAGNKSKRDRLLTLGVCNAFDSRSYDWYDELMEVTKGEGVDVVLNSLAGRHIDLCLQALRPGGWHCEIGKVDIYAENALNLRAFQKNLRFVGIDMDRLVMDDPKLLLHLSQSCLNLLDQGVLPPLTVTTYAYKNYDEALRLMMSGQHEGKLALKVPAASSESNFPIIDCRPVLDPDATYLVTGGLGDLGLKLLSFLAACGARHLTVMDRDPEGRRSVDWIRQASDLAHFFPDCEIHIVSGDVAVKEDVQGCITQLQKPLKGVFHLAGVLDDRLLADMSPESLAKVFAPKACGALHLHRTTAGFELDHFVLFSSIASIFGNPGQINYSAANAFLDGLAAYRRCQGLPGLSYNMAAIAETGMASRRPHVLRTMRAIGIPPVSTAFALINLDYAMRMMSDKDHLITTVFRRPMWNVDSPDYMRSGRLISNQDALGIDSADQLTVESVMALIANKVTELIGHEVDVDEPLSRLGFNSISVVELATFLHEQFNRRANVLDLMTTVSLRMLATAIVHGTENIEETQTEAVIDTVEAEQIQALQQLSRRVPSVFANRLEEHFSHRVGVDPGTVENPANRGVPSGNDRAARSPLDSPKEEEHNRED